MPSHVYILSSHTRVLYVGMTSELRRRVFEHKTKLIDGFTARYHVNQLVYYEEAADVPAALAREKQLKGWSRAKKITLIERANPHWFDLSVRGYKGDLAGNQFAMSEIQWDFDRLIVPSAVQFPSSQDPSTTASTPSLRMET